MIETDGADARPKSELDEIRGAMASLSWIVVGFEDLILDYCRKRSPTGEVLWSKLLEWLTGAGRDEPQAVAWRDLAPTERAAIDLIAVYYSALDGVIARHFPPAPVPSILPAPKPVAIEDTIFERHGSIGERDPHRVAAASAVARVIEKAGLTLAEVESALSLDDQGEAEDEGDDEGDGEDGEEHDGGLRGPQEVAWPDEAGVETKRSGKGGK